LHYWTDQHGDGLDITKTPVRVTPGFVEVNDDHELVVRRQPHFIVDVDRRAGYEKHLTPHAPATADPRVFAVTVARDLHLDVVDKSDPGGRPLRRQFSVTPPRVEQHSGTTGRPKFKVDGELWRYVGGAFALWALAQLAQMIFRPVRASGNRSFKFVTWLTGLGAIGTLLLIVVLPWLVYEVPPLVARLVSGLPGPNTSAAESSQANLAVAAAGSGIVTIASVVRLLRAPVAAAAKKRPMAVAKVAVFLVLLLVVFVVFIGQVQLGAANGPSGHLVAAGAVGIGFLKKLRDWSDLARWAVAGGVLLLLRYAMDAHATSLFPFYKHRMSEAFAVRRDKDGNAEPVPYAEELAWTDAGYANGHGRFKLHGDAPNLVLCATANTYGYGEAPSGRKASSFTFSHDVIGGPDVGYVPTKEYVEALSVGRRKDVTVPSSIAIAGAAFSPGMGKMSKGPIDNLLAVSNARLGVWLPNPMYVKARAKDAKGKLWWDRPGWPQFLREVLGLFRRDTPYVYVSDGGHWENLGMVEALRRGCRNVWVLSAAGDGADSFATIGEAIALAREEVGVKIDIDLEPMRAEWTEDVVEGGLRRGKDGKPLPFAAKGFAIGMIYDANRDGGYPDDPTGYIVVIEANMTTGPVAQPRKEDWDVITWAEGHAIFPDDSTLNQNFNHRLFEAYRMRGRMQVEQAAAAIINAGLRTQFGL
jgi:hypothetical protein